MANMFRDLRADEIDVRVARVITGKNTGVQLLFYKDARVDQNILDETVGPMNWQRAHSRDNANCIVSIWDEKKGQWISKEDTGTESKTEAAKGLASDSFKRACFNWGVGRELYTAPDTTIWNSEKEQKVRIENGKCKDRFAVTELTVTDGVITHVTVYNINLKKAVFTYTAKASEPQAKQEEPAEIQPVTNEVVQNAVGFDPSEPCTEVELQTLSGIVTKAWPTRDIKEIFPKWPGVTKGEYVEFNERVRKMVAEARKKTERTT